MFRNKQKNIDVSQRYEFSTSIELIKSMSEANEDITEKIDFLEYSLDVVRTDLISLYRAKQFYKEVINPNTNLFPFPARFINNEKLVINLADTPLFTIPWKRESITDLIKHFKKEPFIGNDNHLAFYYQYINICYVHNGIHSSTIAKYYKKGSITADTYNMADVYKSIHTNGEKWFYTENNNIIADVFDYRVAVIFEIGRLIYEEKSRCQ